jgi:hypothetical protein
MHPVAANVRVRLTIPIIEGKGGWRAGQRFLYHRWRKKQALTTGVHGQTMLS